MGPGSSGTIVHRGPRYVLNTLNMLNMPYLMYSGVLVMILRVQIWGSGSHEIWVPKWWILGSDISLQSPCETPVQIASQELYRVGIQKGSKMVSKMGPKLGPIPPVGGFRGPN